MEVAQDSGIHPTLFRARRIITMADTEPEAIVTAGGRVIGAGGWDELSLWFPGAAKVDFGDGIVIPGLNDAHMHPSSMVRTLLHVDLSPEIVGSAAELTAALRSRAEQLPPGRWVLGHRYDHAKTTGGDVIDRDFLDAVSADHPVLVVQISGHWGVVNSLALERAGLTDDSAAPPGGKFGRDAAGHLNGRVYERALTACFFGTDGRTPAVPPDSLEDRLAALPDVMRVLHSVGLTSVTDAATSPDDLRLYQEAALRGMLTARVSGLLRLEHFDRLHAAGLQTGIGDDRLRIGGVKAVADGAVAGATCLLEEPYEGSDDHGLQVLSDEELSDAARAVFGTGSRLCVHANGDRAISKVLAAFEKALEDLPSEEGGPGSAPPRIEHCTFVNEELLRRIQRLGATCVPFGSYIAFHGEKLVPYYGERRLERMFAHRWFLDSGIPIAGSSDHGAGPLAPLLALQSCVTRETADRRVLGEAQRITPLEALSLYTVGSAQASGEGAIKGRLAPGYLADFTVLGDDPLVIDPHRLASIPVLSTWVEGEQVWSQS
jgi:predicted amidohydrolase YtcJ